MLTLFLGITLRFTAVGVVAAIVGFLALAKHHKKLAMLHATISLLLWFLTFGWLYFTMPAPSLTTTVNWNLISLLVATLLPGALMNSSNWRKVLAGKGDKKTDGTRKDVSKPAGSAHRFNQVAGLTVVALIISAGVTVVLGITSAKTIAHNAPVTESATTKGAPMPVIDAKQRQMPVVNPPATVLTQINNSLSNIPNANVYDVNHVRAQINKGKLVYVAPLDFDGSYFRYLRYRKVDGYFVVDATSKAAQPKFVKKAMRYTPEAYFQKDAKRLMYAHTANSGYVLMSNAPQLEISEDGTPYYVSTLTKRYGFTNRVDYAHKAVVTLNAQTGAIHFYKTLAQKPKWLDVAVDPSTVSDQVAAWGQDRNGWWNAHGFGGAQAGVVIAVKKAGTEGNQQDITPIMSNGQVYYLQSLTSAKSKQTSVMGYAFTDAATGKTHYYRETHDAMTPDRAQRLAKDLMKQTGWKPKMPMLYRIDGQPTWVVSMLDSSNAFRSYVYLLASGNGTQSTVASGADATEALVKYRNLFTGNPTAGATNGKKTKVAGTVLRVTKNGDLVQFLLTDKPVVYTISAKTDPLASFIQAGDQLSFTAMVSGSTGTITTTVTNQNLLFK